MTLYGIRNCDTVRKARAWLDAHRVAYAFHDYRRDGIDGARVAAWVADHGWTRVLNRAGTTFRGLPPEARAELDEDTAIALMVAHPSLIKRPILDLGSRTIVGFSTDVYAAAFNAAE